MTSVGKKNVRVHRLTWETYNGRKMAARMVSDHLCRNRACCNPEHIEEVSIAENTRRGMSGTNTFVAALKQTHCKRGHERVGDNLYFDKKGRLNCRLCRKEYWVKCGGGKRRILQLEAEVARLTRENEQLRAAKETE